MSGWENYVLPGFDPDRVPGTTAELSFKREFVEKKISKISETIPIEFMGIKIVYLRLLNKQVFPI